MMDRPGAGFRHSLSRLVAILPAVLAVALAAGVAATAVGHAESLRPMPDVPRSGSSAPASQQGEIAMSDLDVSVVVSRDTVLSGEEFLVEVILRNTAAGPVEAPARGETDAFEIVLTPVSGGGDALHLSPKAHRLGLHADDRYADEVLSAEPLAPGETRSYRMYPARLTVSPIPPGAYTLAAGFEGQAPGAGVALTVERRVVVALEPLVQGALSGGHMAFVHRGAGGDALYQATTLPENPVAGSAIRVEDLSSPVRLAQALRADGAPGAAWSAWMTPDGTFAAGIAYATFVAGRVAPVDTGLAEASLQTTGWQDAETDSRATFAVLGRGAEGPELALIRLDADAGWSASVTRAPLPLSALPQDWRLVPRGDGAGYVLFAVESDAAGTSVHVIDIDASGRKAGAPRLLTRAALPFAGLSTPRRMETEAGAEVHLLFGPIIDDSPRMIFRRVPLAEEGGEVETDFAFLVPLLEGQAPSGWEMAGGAPPVAALAAWMGPQLLGVRIAETGSGAVLRDDAPGGAGLSVVTIGPAAWAVWRDTQGAILSQRFP